MTILQSITQCDPDGYTLAVHLPGTRGPQGRVHQYTWTLPPLVAGGLRHRVHMYVYLANHYREVRQWTG